jgi:hypothetical protein
MAILVSLALILPRRSRRYVRGHVADQVPRINPYRYLEARKPMTDAERMVYRNLHAAVSPALNVQFQTAVSAIVTHKPILIASRNIAMVRSVFNRLRVDFALYSFSANRYVAVVELDHKTHDTAEQREEDARRDRILIAAGIKVVRLRYGADTIVQALAERFAGFIPHRL